MLPDWHFSRVAFDKDTVQCDPNGNINVDRKKNESNKVNSTNDDKTVKETVGVSSKLTVRIDKETNQDREEILNTSKSEQKTSFSSKYPATKRENSQI